MGQAIQKDRTSLEGFDDLWDSNEPVDQISKNIQGILKALVDERIQVNQEHHLVEELKKHINTLEDQNQKLSWKLGQREKELSVIHTDFNLVKKEKEVLQRITTKNTDLEKENLEIRRMVNELSNQILQEKAKNEMLADLLREFKQPELVRIEKKLGIEKDE